MALPSLTLVEADLHASQAKAAAAIAIFLAGFSTAPLAVGPLADRFGRKPVMLVGLALFTLSAAGSALALTIDALLAFRLEPHSRPNQMCAHAKQRFVVWPTEAPSARYLARPRPGGSPGRVRQDQQRSDARDDAP
jgi:MFS family permease